MSKKSKKKAYNQDIKLNCKIDSMVSVGRKRVQQFADMNRLGVRYIYGDQISKKRKKNWDYPVINRCYADMTQEIAILTANNPRIEVLPREDGDIDVAKNAGIALKGYWSDVLKMRIKIIQAEYDCHINGVMIAKWFYEPKSKWNHKKADQTGDGWEGEINVNIVRPCYFGCDPDVELAVEIPTKARFIFTERWVDKRWAAHRWPKYAKYLQDCGEIDKEGNFISDEIEVDDTGGGIGADQIGFDQSTNDWNGKESDNLSEEQLQKRLANVILGVNDSGKSDDSSSNNMSVRVQEIYFRDYTTKTVESLKSDWPAGQGEAEHIYQQDDDPTYYDSTKPKYDENDNTVGHEAFTGDWPQKEIRPEYQEPLYPTGRFVIRLGGDVIVEDRAWEYDNWPFAVAPYYLLPHIWQGVNCVELSRGFQDWMNTIASHLTNYIKYFSDPHIWVEEEALVRDSDKKKQTFPNWAGSIVRFARGKIGRAIRHEPPSLPPTLFQIFELFRSSDQDLKGVHDVTQGKASTGKNTLGEMDMLNRNSRQRLALQGAFLDVFLHQINTGILELMQRHLDPGKWIRWTGDNADSAKSSIQWTQEMVDSEFDVILEPVSTLPYDEERESGKYKMALDVVGPAMLEDFLKKLKIQNVPKIMANHEIVGPLTQLLEMAKQSGVGPEQLLIAVKAQLDQVKIMTEKGETDGIE